MNDPQAQALGSTLGKGVSRGSMVAGAYAAKRHWDATGDLKTTAIAGVRGWIRWSCFAMMALYSGYLLMFVVLAPLMLVQDLFQANAEVAQITGYELIDPREYMLDTPTSLGAGALAILTAITLNWFYFPYVLGVLFVRFSDRSLFKVAHWKLYRRLLPFAHQVRRVPDWVLFVAGASVPWFCAGLVRTLAEHLLP